MVNGWLLFVVRCVFPLSRTIPKHLSGVLKLSPRCIQKKASSNRKPLAIKRLVDTEALVTILCGSAVGFGFALTAGGGSVLAVPMLTYVLGLQPHKAICVSMATIATLAWLAAVQKALKKEIDIYAAVLIGVGGIVATPFGVWLNRLISPRLLLIIFALVAASVGIRMFIAQTENSSGFGAVSSTTSHPVKPFFFGSISGFLAGLLGIGGGFVIVPSLVLLRRMKMHLAVSTSFLSIAMIGSVATTLHLLTGQRISVMTTLFFITGGVSGLALGIALEKDLPNKVLQKVFAAVILAAALSILVGNLKTIRSAVAFIF